MNFITCPSCGSAAEIRGVIPDCTRFAGRKLEIPLPGGNLCACRTCSLNFRWPRPAKKFLDDLYRGGMDTTWSSRWEDRKDFALASDLLATSVTTGTILDIGCFDGSFLSGLGDNWRRYGVEINSEASERARRRGVELIADDIAELRRLRDQFGVVTAFDVIEHVENPLAFVNEIMNIVEPSGLIILSSGDTSAKSWRLLGSRYWYCHIAEHISFINLKWCHFAAQRVGAEIVFLRRFSHVNASFRQKCKQLIVNLAHAFTPLVDSPIRKISPSVTGNPRYATWLAGSPPWIAARDHIMIGMRKVESTKNHV